MFDPIDITITDPRSLEGNPYEVAEFSVAQCLGALHAVTEAARAAFLMARNAEMERNLATGMPPAGSDYGNSPQGRMFTRIEGLLAEATTSLRALERAVAFDPKHPPRSGR